MDSFRQFWKLSKQLMHNGLL